jgi:hypothetical protein
VPRRWNEIDWDQPRPSLDDVRASWTALEWTAAPIADPALDHYLELVRATHVNGGCLFGRWRAGGYSDTTAWFAARNRYEEYELLRLLFDSDAVRSGLADLRIPNDLDRVPGGLTEQWAGALCLDGILAGVVVTGGAYKRYRGPASEAKAVAALVVEALIQQRFEDVRLDATHEAWTPWFGAAWNHTYVVTDAARAEITVLCITDRD